MINMGSLSVIIVSWNARKLLQDCLLSVQQTGGNLVHEIIVVDNASTDGSPEMVLKDFPRVNLIRSEKNLGFAAANNLAIRQASGEFLALVNSDVVVHSGCFQELVYYLEREPGTALVGPKVFGRDGEIQLTCGKLPTVWNTFCRFSALDRLFSKTPIFSGFEMRHWDYGKCGEVQALSGCFWVARREAVQEVGGLDETFFFYAEDFDWCKRFSNGGWKIVYVPMASATHFGGGSSANSPLKYNVEMLRGNLIYWRKHHGRLGWFVYFVLIVFQHSLRVVARGLAGLTGPSIGLESRRKLRELIVCLRGLFTGKGI